MKISEHITNTIENWRIRWGDTLKGWMASWLSFGFDVFFKVLATSAAPKLKPLIDSLEGTGKVPPELQPILDELKSPTGEAGAMFANSAGGALIGGAIGKIVDSILLPIAYAVNSVTRNVLLSPDTYLKMWQRGEFSEETLNEYFSWLGMTEEDIELLKKSILFLPYAADLVRWQAKEVFEPEMIERYGLDAEFEEVKTDLFAKVGVSEEQARNYWRAHWEHASWTQVTEMLHRGHLTPEQVYDWYRLVEIPPYWRDKLTKISYAPYTRVDARRMWDMGVLDDTALLTAYKDIGYDEEHAQNMTLWTKVYVTFPDLIARYKNGWIDKETVLSEIVALGMKPERAQWLFETKFKKVGAERIAAEKDITATDIVMGVKKGIITWAEGVDLLMDLGYDEDEAEFKLAVRLETEGGSPGGIAEFKRLTQLYRVSQGLPTKMTAAEIKAAEKELAEKYPKKVPLTEAELKLRVDTTRRLRRNRQLTRDQEIASLLELGLTVDLATAYANNDDLRLRPKKEE